VKTAQPSPVQPTPSTYFDKLAGSLRLRPSVVPYLVLSALSLGVAWWIYRATHRVADLGTFAAFASTIALVPLAMKTIFHVIWEWRSRAADFARSEDLDSDPRVAAWIESEFKAFLRSAVPLVVGLAYATFALLVYQESGTFQDLSALQALLGKCVIWLGSLMCGIGLMSIFYLGRLIWRMGKKYHVRVANHTHGILSTGDALLRCYLVIAIVWAVYTSSAVWNLSGRVLTLLALSLPAVCLFISSFVVCQLPLHDRMLEAKRARLKALDDLLQELTPVDVHQLTEHRKEQVDFCVEEIERVASWPEWPFRIRAFSGVVAASVGAIAPTILDIVVARWVPKP
jgi:hypothetical protein